MHHILFLRRIKIILFIFLRSETRQIIDFIDQSITFFQQKDQSKFSLQRIICRVFLYGAHHIWCESRLRCNIRVRDMYPGKEKFLALQLLTQLFSAPTSQLFQKLAIRALLRLGYNSNHCGKVIQCLSKNYSKEAFKSSLRFKFAAQFQKIKQSLSEEIKETKKEFFTKQKKQTKQSVSLGLGNMKHYSMFKSPQLSEQNVLRQMAQTLNESSKRNPKSQQILLVLSEVQLQLNQPIIYWSTFYSLRSLKPLSLQYQYLFLHYSSKCFKFVFRPCVKLINALKRPIIQATQDTDTINSPPHPERFYYCALKDIMRDNPEVGATNETISTEHRNAISASIKCNLVYSNYINFLLKRDVPPKQVLLLINKQMKLYLMDPEHYYYGDLALIYYLIGQHQKALELMSKMRIKLQQKQEDSQIYQKYIQSMRQIYSYYDLKAALRYSNKICDLFPTLRKLQEYQKAKILFKLSQYQQSYQCFTEADLKYMYSNEDVESEVKIITNLRRGIALLRMGQVAYPQQLFEQQALKAKIKQKIKERQEDRWEMLINYLQLNGKFNDSQEAIAYFSDVIENEQMPFPFLIQLKIIELQSHRASKRPDAAKTVFYLTCKMLSKEKIFSYRQYFYEIIEQLQFLIAFSNSVQERDIGNILLEYLKAILFQIARMCPSAAAEYSQKSKYPINVDLLCW